MESRSVGLGLHQLWTHRTLSRPARVQLLPLVLGACFGASFFISLSLTLSMC